MASPHWIIVSHPGRPGNIWWQRGGILEKVSLSKPTVLEIHLWTSNDELYWTNCSFQSYGWNPYNEIQLWDSLQRELQAECSSVIWKKHYTGRFLGKEKSYTSDSPIRLAKFPTNFWEFLQKVSHLIFPKFVPNETKKKFSEKSLRSFDKPTDKQTVDME